MHDYAFPTALGLGLVHHKGKPLKNWNGTLEPWKPGTLFMYVYVSTLFLGHELILWYPKK